MLTHSVYFMIFALGLASAQQQQHGEEVCSADGCSTRGSSMLQSYHLVADAPTAPVVEDAGQDLVKDSDGGIGSDTPPSMNDPETLNDAPESLTNDEPAPEAEETSELQASANGKCANDFGNNRGRGISWHLLTQGKVASQISGNVGQIIGSPGQPFWSNINVCSYITTGAGQPYAGQTKEYACRGSDKGKEGPCVNKKGAHLDCYNGLCASKSNIKHDWSAPVDGLGCHRIDGLGGVGNRGRPFALQLKDERGKPAAKFVDPNCKVMCESWPGCTGFTLLKAKKKPTCFFFGGVTQASAESSKTPGPSCQKDKCCAHKNYKTYFITRK